MNLSTFTSEVSKLNPEGNIQRAYENITLLVNMSEKDVEGNIIDYNYILEKYKDYVEAWSLKYAKKLESGYLPKSAEQLNIEDFVLQSKYRESFMIGVQNINRDIYLFGKNEEDMYEKIQYITKRVNQLKSELD